MNIYITCMQCPMISLSSLFSPSHIIRSHTHTHTHAHTFSLSLSLSLSGIRFLWENIVEEVAHLDTQPGLGCILAHAMGLGKTLQTVAFVQTFLLKTGNPRSAACFFL